jgi:hypothetical protein
LLELLVSCPQISIVIPLPDHRGHALEGIRSWLEQSNSAASCQVIVVHDGREPELEQVVGELLRPHDLLIAVPDGSLHDCYNAGAHAAAADLLLFTESHVKAERDCVEQILLRMKVDDLDVAALASGGINESRFAAQEQTIYEEALADRISGGWNLCTVRGFATRRATFERSGGFLARYGHMSELLLGATLKHQGARLGYATQARVWHFNDGTRDHFANELSAFGRDEIRFRVEQPNSPLLEYLGPCPVWEMRERFERRAAIGEVGRSIVRAGAALLRGNFKQCGLGLEAAVRALPFIAFGSSWLVWRAMLSCLLARAALVLGAFSERFYYAAFRAFWNSQIRRGRAEAIREWLVASAGPFRAAARLPMERAPAALPR